MHTIKVIAGGFALLAACLLVGRLIAGAGSSGLIGAARVFIGLWLVIAGINMWIGVSKAGFSVADEAPIFLVVFGVPAAVAGLLVWWLSRGVGE